ncbi:hypothetical protein [Paenibacillus alba]|uniref:Alpha/beta hydrolase n=1 Tax=Paenibacillus alba TaxID=1197127 RepID=A0ABU6G1H8_9BACL|nr:hypothetical protein [Paenibacillus alba]MEC0227127.1 hypothetical protein [Paenibacillus alba]
MARHSDQEEIVIYISAGFATAPYFLDAFGAAMAERYASEGIRARVVIHYPYGDWTRERRKQLKEIVSDLWNNAHQKPSYYGGKSLTELITQDFIPGQKLLLIGHSAGAVASVQAAEIMEKQEIPLLGVIQIGSPKCAIPSSIKHKVLYLKAANQLDQSTDPIPRLGTWGGWAKSRMGTFRWNGLKHAPIHRRTLYLIGGHADYFRDHNPYIWQDATNLQTTVHTIWQWLNRTEKDDEHD